MRIVASLFVILLYCEAINDTFDELTPFQIGHYGCKKEVSTYNIDPTQIKVYFYEFPKNLILQTCIQTGARKILNHSRLDKKRKFILFIPGYKTYMNDTAVKHFIDSFEKSNKYLIIVDHSALTDESYLKAVKAVSETSQAIGDFLVGLRYGNIYPKNIHGIGFTLGCQILRHAAEILFLKTGTKLSRLTALDPAKRCLANTIFVKRAKVAEYIEVYHCNDRRLKIDSFKGDIAFYLLKSNYSVSDCNYQHWGVSGTVYASRCNPKYCLQFYSKLIKHNMRIVAVQYFYNNKIVVGFGIPNNTVGAYYIKTDKLFKPKSVQR